MEGLSYVLNPSHFPFLFIGVAGGIVVGALPGLTGSVGIILLLPFLYYLEPATSLIMLSGMFCGAIYGGSISAILISTPGTPSAAATVLDGYPLSEKGEAGKAIGVATIASTVGGVISTLCMIFISPQLARFALKFGPEEYFALMVFGLTVIASVSGASLVKGLISGFFGLLIASIGIDELTGYARYSFDIPNLMTGFPMLPVLIGLFAISQIFIELANVGKELKRYDQKIKGVLPTWREFKRLITVIIPASFLGTFIGIIPGTGGAIASFMAYNEARRFSKDPDSFGKGNLAGVAAPEAANNGTTGGAMVPLLTLGIPGDVVTAVMLGALLLIGVRPGPLLFQQNPQIIRALFVGFMLAQFLILGLGLASVKVFPRILKVPISILFPVIFALCFLGSFSLNNSIYDMFVALLFGVVGYFMRKYGFAAAPMILGVILGPLAERELGKALIMSHGNWTTLVQSPIALVFYGISVLSVTYSLLRMKRLKRKRG
ncbi:MAG: tripartite tricarboxylate transporter permease [Spirochaetaceae bacterium]|nr:MAG: tripartite tricarboxylate transporter permease [Spirochaetaceae bacterium]